MIYGVEVLVPVDREFESTGQYVYKPMFKLVNAVSYRFYGKSTDFSEVEVKLNDYIKARRLNAASGFYYVVQDTESDNLQCWETYVAVNENIV